MKRLVRVSTFVVGLLVGGNVVAQEAPPAPTHSPTIWEQKPNAVRGIFGILGSPVGVFGVEVERSVAPWASVHGGLGVGGVGPTDALQVAAGGSWRPLRGDRWSIGPAASLSFGSYREITFDGERQALRGNVLWTNLEGFAAFRFHGGVDLRFALGASIDTVCWGGACRSTESYESHRRIGGGNHSLGYTTVGVGYAW